MNRLRPGRALFLSCVLPLTILLAACSGGGGGSDGGNSAGGTQPLHTVGGSISGLTADGLVLANGSDTLAVPANATSFTMPTALAGGNGYQITVQTQPTGLTCSVAGGSGTVGDADVMNAVVTCSVNAFTLGGSISGLSSDGLVLANGSDTLTVAANGTRFVMPTAVAFGSSYDLVVKTQPTGLTCSVAGGSGTMGDADVSSVAVTCGPDAFTLGGSIGGLISSGLVLANGSDTLAVDANATAFTMPATVAFGSSYTLTVKTQPTGLTCSVAGGSGTMGDANVTSVAVTCSVDAFTLGGSISGLISSGLVLANGGDTLAVDANATAFTMPATVAFGGSYDLTVKTQPTGLTCAVAGGSGTMGAANVTSVTVTCDARTFTLGGSISGLTTSGLVLANGSDSLSVAANASSFTLPAAVPFAARYDVTVKTQTDDQTCTVADGSGIMGDAAVSDVAISCVAASFSVSTFAGSGAAGSDNGVGTAASFRSPAGVAVDGSGNIFVGDQTNREIRKITPDGTVSTFANPGGGSGSFSNVRQVAIDSSGSLYVADQGNNKIRKVAPDGTVSTLAGSGVAGSDDGLGTAASFNNPIGVAVDGSGNVYVADSFNCTIRKIAADGTVSTLAGLAGDCRLVDGTASVARFRLPLGVAVDTGGTVYVADNFAIRKITPDGSVSTLAGGSVQGNADGTGTAALFSLPEGMVIDASGNLFVTDTGNNSIRRITPAGVVTTFAGTGTAGSADGPAASATFDKPQAVAIDGSGNLVVADTVNNTIRRIKRD